MPDGKQRAADILRGPEGQEIYFQLVRYADRIARIHGWRTGSILPGGASPMSVVHEVVEKVLDPDGPRNWDEKKEPVLLNALKGMVRSDIGHLYDRIEESLVEPINIVLPDGEERTGDFFPSTKVRLGELNPEQHLLRQERTKLEFAAMNLVLEEVEGKDDLESVFLALYETNSPSEIAAKTGLPIERVYAARRELDRIVAKIPLARVIRAAREEKKS
jgi:hypothetical protein